MHYFRYDWLEQHKEGDLIELDRAESNHLFRILRACAGMTIGLLDGRGRRARAVVEEKNTVRLTEMELVPEPVPTVVLYLAPPKKQKNDGLLKAVTELGVRRIQPLLCERSVSVPDADSIAGRWHDLLFEACKQSSNAYMPELSAPVRMQEAVNDAARSCDAVFYGSPRTERSVCCSTIRTVGFFVGPEGGFTPEEEQLMESAGFLPMRIGCWTLRVETAAVAGVAVLLDRLTKK